MTDPSVPMDRKKILKDTAIAGNVITTLTVPAGERWLLLNATFTLTTDATVANRLAQINTQDVANTQIFLNRASAVVASQTGINRYFNRAFDATDAVRNSLGHSIVDAGEDVVLQLIGGVVGDAYTYLLEYLKVEI